MLTFYQQKKINIQCVYKVLLFALQQSYTPFELPARYVLTCYSHPLFFRTKLNIEINIYYM